MSKEQIVTKLTSRKFWMAVVGFVTAILVGFNVGDNDIAKITAIITAGATLIAYIVGEGMVDVTRVKAQANAPNQDNASDVDIIAQEIVDEMITTSAK